MRIAVLCGGLMFLSGATPEPSAVPAPALKVGDTWVFDTTQQRGATGFAQQRIDLTVERVSGDSVLVGFKRDGAPTGFEDHVVGPDWSQRHVVDGQETPTTRPFNFPMRVGQKWTVDFQDSTRRGNQLSLHVHRDYVVRGWENIIVPAGTYRAIKIEANGSSEGVIVTPGTVIGGATSSVLGGSTFTRSQPGNTAPHAVRDYDEIYYVPEIKNYAKIIEEQYNTQDILVKRDKSELVSFRPGM